jgi:hypothetical protein
MQCHDEADVSTCTCCQYLSTCNCCQYLSTCNCCQYLKHAIGAITFLPVLAVIIFPSVLPVMKESFPEIFPEPCDVMHRAYALISSKCCTFHTNPACLVKSVIVTKTTVGTKEQHISCTWQTCGFHDVADVPTCTCCQYKPVIATIVLDVIICPPVLAVMKESFLQPWHMMHACFPVSAAHITHPHVCLV